MRPTTSERGNPPVTDPRTGTPLPHGITAAGAARVFQEVLPARGSVHLYTRAHIDLQRVAGALCRS